MKNTYKKQDLYYHQIVDFKWDGGIMLFVLVSIMSIEFIVRFFVQNQPFYNIESMPTGLLIAQKK